MKTLLKHFVAAMCCLLLASSASNAQTAVANSGSSENAAVAKKHPMSVNHRELRQQKRIKEGVQSGELTKHEVKKLERGEQHIKNEEARMRVTGGGLSPSEKAKIQHDLNKENRKIYRQKHDAQKKK